MTYTDLSLGAAILGLTIALIAAIISLRQVAAMRRAERALRKQVLEKELQLQLNLNERYKSVLQRTKDLTDYAAKEHLDTNEVIQLIEDALQSLSQNDQERIRRALYQSSSTGRASYASKFTMENEQYPEILETLEATLTRNPSDASAWNSMGIGLANLGRHEEALGAFNRALSLSGNYPEALNNLGVEETWAATRRP